MAVAAPPRVPHEAAEAPDIVAWWKKSRRRMVVLVNMFKKMKLRWLKLKYICMLRRLKESYRNIVKDMAEAGASIEAFQQRLFVESTFAIPIGVAFSSYPSRLG